MYNGDQALPIDVRQSLLKWKWDDNDELFDLNICSSVVASATMFIHEIFEHLLGHTSSSIKVGDFMLPRIFKQQNRTVEIFRTLS